MSRRAGALLIAAALALVAALAVALVVRGRDDGPRSTTAGGGTTVGTRIPPPPPPPVGDFPGAPPELTVPPGGRRQVLPADDGVRVVLRRADGSPLAVTRVDGAGDYLDARYFDRAGRLTVVISATRPAPAAVTPGRAGARCGSAARADAGYRFTRLPVAWRLNPAGRPSGLAPGPALAAMRRARGTWGANRNHCRIADRSRARFAFRGATGRRTGLDGVSVVEFGAVRRLGSVCVGTVACTITWVRGRRATESDVRIDHRHPAGFFAGSSGRRRGFDLQSVMVHESGHSLGFTHVAARDVVMFSELRRGSTAGRRLGRGDALANNAKY